MFLVVTTGRSGSTTIARVLNQVKGVYAVHEAVPPLIAESCGLRSGSVTSDEVKAVLAQTRKPDVEGEVYVESNQTLSLMIPELVATFPEARFIWLIRNGLDVVASTYQKQWYTGHSENSDRYEDATDLEKAWIDGRIRGDHVGEMSEAAWAALDRFERCCWYWGYVNRVIGEDLERHAPDRYYTLRLEDLERDLAKLVDWMGFSTSDLPGTTRENIAKRIPFHWSEWSSEEHQAFGRRCGDAMDLFYPSWRAITALDSRLFVAPAIAGLSQKVREEQARGRAQQTRAREQQVRARERLALEREQKVRAQARVQEQQAREQKQQERARERLAVEREQKTRAQARARANRARAEKAERKLRQARAELEAIKGSRMWRLTRRFFPPAPQFDEDVE